MSLTRRLEAIARVGRDLLVMLRFPWEAHSAMVMRLAALTVLQGLLPIATAWTTKLLFDRLGSVLHTSGPPNWTAPLLPILTAQGLFFIIGQMIPPVKSYVASELERSQTALVENNLYGKAGEFVGIAYFEDSRFHDTFRLAEMGLRMGPAQSLFAMTGLVQSVLTMISFLAVLIAFSPSLAIYSGLAALPQLVLHIKFGQQRAKTTLEQSSDERRASYFQGVLSSPESAKELRLFGLPSFFLDRLLAIRHRINAVRRSQDEYELRWLLALETLSALVFTGTFVIVVIRAFEGNLTLGDVTLYTNAVRSLQGTFVTLIASVGGLAEHASYFRHYLRLMALPQPVRLSMAPRPVPPLITGLELKGVSFRYSDSTPWVLRHLDLIIPARKRLALVGLNGAGKTTLVKLLSRLYDPQEGTITWDGIDIAEFDPSEFRTHLGTVFQDFVRYPLPASENIGFGDLASIEDIDRIRSAAQQAGVHNTIEALPQGYRTVLSRALGENGEGAELSGGEWQKIALARMFMRNCEVLILDEPTASLDAEAEYESYKRFAELTLGQTCLLISHRFTTLRIADLIAVLHDGGISELGTHDALLAQGGIYSRLFHIQTDRYR